VDGITGDIGISAGCNELQQVMARSLGFREQ
jgi:hypothetical protein